MLNQLNTNQAMTWASSQCGRPIEDARFADADRFVKTFGIVETVELTNLEDPSQTVVNCSTLNLALEDAYSLLSQAQFQATWCGGGKIEASFQRWQVIIARYYLDILRRRPEVRQDYEDVLKDLEDSKQAICLGPRPKGEQTLGARNIKMTAQPRVWDRRYFESEKF